MEKKKIQLLEYYSTSNSSISIFKKGLERLSICNLIVEMANKRNISSKFI